MNFTKWLIKQGWRRGDIGRLGRMVIGDSNWPANDHDIDGLLLYVWTTTNDATLVDALRAAWDEYSKSE